ncbi:alpha/beta fold hydrolase [Vagococcus fluvialis]|uniref:alpha/beta fold hydrolase n=1 Tax=Vagococcus fluvialis TaxID=2738 RepID=UPI0037D52E46
MSPFSDNPNNWLGLNVFEETHPLLLNDSYYEQMKFQADILIRQITLEKNIPLIVINPPTVIGNKDTGETEQLAGFGLFMKIIRKGLLPIIPGGEDYRLPVIHRDVLANFIVDSLLKSVNESATYTLVQNKNEDIKLPELMSIVSNTMNMKAPKLVVPMPLLKTVMTLGGSRVTGVSKSSLNFMTKRQFNNHQVTTDFPAILVKELSAKESLPLVIADIDYTLTFGNREIAPFARKSINQTCVYSLNGLGKTIVLIHGLLSEASDLFSLGIELNKKTGRPILIVYLPGFGRSPFKSDKSILNPYLDVIKIIQQETGSEATFIGHSFGAALLLYAYENKILLQPPVQKIATDLPLWMNRIVLKAASTKQLSNHFMKQGLFSVEEEIPDTYFQNLNKSFSSPRILNTNLLLNNRLQQMTFNLSLSENIYSIWGTEDKSYTKPNNFNVIATLFSGHHFPISQPLETAEVIEELV